MVEHELVWHVLQIATAGDARIGFAQEGSHQATEPQGHVSRSPTPDMASAQPPSAPAMPTDNDMTLPWGDPLEQQAEGDDSHDAAALADTQVFEPSHQAEQPVTASVLLPDTQANDLPHLPAEAQVEPHAAPFAEPTQVLGAPTQLLGEPTQLALPVGPVSAASSARTGSQEGTALASAAAQAMTGAHPSQASLLPSSAGFPTVMPSLVSAQATGQPAAAAGSTAPASSGSARDTGSAQAPSSLPISRPEADAVLHLPSQPSGSQHAAHPHGPPRSPSGKPAVDQSAKSISQHQPSAATSLQQGTVDEDAVDREEQAQGSAAAAATAEAGSSGHNTLLDSILGHDDDDSIWMPPASLPDSQGHSQGAAPAQVSSQSKEEMQATALAGVCPLCTLAVSLLALFVCHTQSQIALPMPV